MASGLNIDTKKYPARSLAAAISNLKNELIDAADGRGTGRAATMAKIVAEVYDGYQAGCRRPPRSTSTT